jgi:uncharacterized membrane protein YphA (DoxX/SURF4 family)
MTMGSDPLLDELSLVFSRACIELARAQLQQQENNTPTYRAAVARCRAERDALRSSYTDPDHSRRRADPPGPHPAGINGGPAVSALTRPPSGVAPLEEARTAMRPTQERSAATTRSWSPPSPRVAEPVEIRGSTESPRHVDVVLTRLADASHRYGPVALRMSLALVFVWFGALKLTGHSPVEGLIGATLPFLSTDLTLPALGFAEVVLGLAVAVGKAPRMVLVVLAGHLIGTFMSFITAPEFMFDDGNPLLLTADGEFVLKNLVLISAALVLIGRHQASRSRPAYAR